MTNGETTLPESGLVGTTRVKRGMAEMLKGGVIMDVVCHMELTVPAAARRNPPASTTHQPRVTPSISLYDNIGTLTADLSYRSTHSKGSRSLEPGNRLAGNNDIEGSATSNA